MGLCSVPVVGQICDAAGGAVANAAGDAVTHLAELLRDAEVKLVGDLVTAWTNVGAPTIDAASGPVGFLRAATHWLVGFLAVLGLLVAAGRLAWERRGEAGKDAAAGMLRLTLITGASAAAITLVTSWGDDFSTWIIGQALHGGSFGAAVQGRVTLATVAIGPGLMIVLALAGIIACLIQIVLLLVRYAMLGLVAGLLPVASALPTAEGKQWSKKLAGWGLAFCLYKPAAAVIYAFALQSLSKQSSDLDQIAGLVMLVMAVAALPALMKFLVPAVSGVAGGGSGGGAAMAGAGVAMGARLIPGARSGGGSAGGGPSPGPAASSASPSGAGQAGGASGAGAGGAGAGASTAAAGGPAAAGGGAAGAAGGGAASTGATGVAAGAGAATAGVGAAVVVGAKAAGDAVKGAAHDAAASVTDQGGPDGSR